MCSRLTCALLTALLLLVSPAAALAQGAGSDQYEDPFAEEPTQAPPPQQPAPGAAAPGAGTGAGAGQAPSPAPAPAGAEAAAAAPAPPAPGAAAQPAQPVATGATLPETGADAMVIALLGGAMLLAGAVIRLRLRAHERRLD
jgi:LPXTG-motif cell wall-anchored protein